MNEKNKYKSDKSIEVVIKKKSLKELFFFYKIQPNFSVITKPSSRANALPIPSSRAITQGSHSRISPNILSPAISSDCGKIFWRFLPKSVLRKQTSPQSALRRQGGFWKKEQKRFRKRGYFWRARQRTLVARKKKEDRRFASISGLVYQKTIKEGDL